MSRFYRLENGVAVPCTVDEWAAFFEGKSSRVIEQTKLTGDVMVSTVFLGMDHGWGGGPAVLFESMVFGGPDSETQERYCTMGEAKIGHWNLVDQQIAHGFERLDKE